MTTDTAYTSPLLDETSSLRAYFTDFAGWRMPLKFSGDLAEHHAVRGTAGLFDLSHMGEIVVSGPDAARLLDYALVGELSRVSIGRAKYSLMCGSGGAIIDDVVVYRLSDDRYMVVANAGNAPTVYQELVGRAERFTVSLHDESSRTALVAVQGPAAQDIVQTLVPDKHRGLVADLKYYAVTPAVLAGIEGLLSRTGYTGEDGFEVYVPADDAVALWRAMLEATTAHGGIPAGLASRDTLRLEAGMPLYGHELTRQTNPYEAGLGSVVRLNKDFVGRDALAASSERPTTRTLVGLAGSGRRAARPGYVVYPAAGEAAIGAVTSGALSPTLGHPIALAYVDTVCAVVGTELSVDIRGNRERFTIVPLPFYRRS